MSERRDDPREIIGKALEEMAAEAGGGFDPQVCNLADFCRRTGLTRSRARTTEGHGFRVLPHGNTGRRAGTTVPAGHTGLVDDLLGRGAADSQVIYGRLVGQGCRGGLTSVKAYVAPRKGRGGRATGEPLPALRDRARSGVPDGLGPRHGRRTGRRRAQDGVPRHGVPPLRQPPRRALPQRAPGEPAHGDGPAPSWPWGSPARRPRTA